jgi:sirohydrochlorin ferrochelatase
VEQLVRRVAVLRPGLPVRVGFVELAEPSLDHVLASLGGRPAVVVPLLLGAGYHTRVDIAGRVPPGTPVAVALGPHPLLAHALLDRIREAGWRPGEPVILAGAGSTEPQSVEAARGTARLLAAATGSPVRTAFVATSNPRLSEALAHLRAAGTARPLTIAPYLLAPGRFATAVTRTAVTRTAGNRARVAAPLGAHDAIARLILRRYDEARTCARSGRLALAGG